MSLTENALRKLQRDGLFAVGPAGQPPAESQESPTATDPSAADEGAQDGAAPNSDAPEPSAAGELAANDDAAAAGLPPLPETLTEPLVGEPPSQPEAPAYDPVIRPLEDVVPAPPAECEVEPRDDGSAPVDVTQQLDEVDLRRRPLEDYGPSLSSAPEVKPADESPAPADVTQQLDETDLGRRSMADYARSVSSERGANVGANLGEESSAPPDVSPQMDEVDLRRQPMEDYVPVPPSQGEAEPRDETSAPVDVTQQLDEADLGHLSAEWANSQALDPPIPERDEFQTGVPESAPASVVPDGPGNSGPPDAYGDQPVEAAVLAEELTATDPQKTAGVQESLVAPAAKVAAANSVPFEQTVLERLSKPDYAEPFQELQQALSERCGHHLPASLLTVSPRATARSAELVVHLSLLWGTTDEEILMVDANLEEQTLTRQLGALGQPGLCDILTGTCSPDDLVRSTSQNRIHFIPCGDDMVGISRDLQQLDPLLLQRLLEHWCHQYHRVLIDVGSISASLAMPLAEVCEASLLVACMQDIELPQIQSAAETLLSTDRPVLGCVLTDLPR